MLCFLGDGLSVEELVFLDLGLYFVDSLHHNLVDLLSYNVRCLEDAVKCRWRQVPLSIVRDSRPELWILGRRAPSLQIALRMPRRNCGFEGQLKRWLCLRERRLTILLSWVDVGQLQFSGHSLSLGREARFSLGEAIDKGLELESYRVHSHCLVVVVLRRRLVLGVWEYRVLEVLHNVVHLTVPLVLVFRKEPVLVYVREALVQRLNLFRPLIDEILLLQDWPRVYEGIDAVDVVPPADGNILSRQPSTRV